MRSPERGLVGLTLAALAACTTGSGLHGPPADWLELAATPRPFTALYRMECCGRRGLLTTVRFDGSALAATVVAQPGGTVLRVWLERGQGWAQEPREPCRVALPAGELPLAEGRSLPLDVALTGLLLSGLAPEASRPDGDGSGWLTASVDDVVWQGRVEGAPARLARVRLLRAGVPVLDARLSSHRLDRIPGALTIAAGEERFELSLVAWKGGGPLERPAWIGGPECRVRR